VNPSLGAPHPPSLAAEGPDSAGGTPRFKLCAEFQEEPDLAARFEEIRCAQGSDGRLKHRRRSDILGEKKAGAFGHPLFGERTWLVGLEFWSEFFAVEEKIGQYGAQVD
jgi:hypothetical protein